MIGAGLAQQLIRRVGVRPVLLIGWIVAHNRPRDRRRSPNAPVGGSYLGDLLVGLLPMSIGMGLTFVPMTLLATDELGRR